MVDFILIQMSDKQLHINTPLVESLSVGRRTGLRVYFKFECVQPTNSFKVRGVGRLCTKAAQDGAKFLVCSTDGNSGLATAYSGRKLGLKVKVVLPQTTPLTIVQMLSQEGADVEVYGRSIEQANDRALEYAKEPGSAFIHPFDDPVIWDGVATMVEEVIQQIPEKPGCIVCSCGGGGLACGLVIGLRKVGWHDVPVIAMESKGTESFNASIQAGKLITLPHITSICQSLGARSVTPQLLEFAKSHPLISRVVSDKEAVNAVISFLDDHYHLVEPACGVALASVYGNTIPQLIKDGKVNGNRPIIVVASGGSIISLDSVVQYKKQFGIK